MCVPHVPDPLSRPRDPQGLMDAENYLKQVAHLRLESERRLAMLVTSVMFVPNLLFALADRALVADPATLHLLYTLRGVNLLMWLVGIWCIRRAPSHEALGRVIFALSLGLIVFVLWISWVRPPDNWMPVRTLIVISFFIFVAYPNRFRDQLIPWAVLLVGTLGLILVRYATMTAVDRVSALTHFLLAGMLGMLVAQNRRALDHDLDASQERERGAMVGRERATAALRSLEGIIPICSYCHEVRTEAGAWEQLDAYVRSRTDADFSHGICPSCWPKHFPDITPTPRP